MGGGGTSVKTIGNAAVLIDSPFDSLKATATTKKRGGGEKGGTTMTPSTEKTAMRMEKKKLVMTTEAKINNGKRKPRKESCGVVELVQAMMVCACTS